MSIKLIIEKECAGCGTCASACPKNAIGYEMNKSGFFSATLDETLCVECGLCEKICPRIQKNNGERLLTGRTFATKIRDEDELLKCSSGGVAYAAYQYALSNEMYVIGVYYDEEKRQAIGALSRLKEETETFRGSKYLQADMRGAFEESIRLAKENPVARFFVVAMPCQIAGLNARLKRSGTRDQFILVDMYCHGVPSYKIWYDYCDSIKAKYGENPQKVNFRSKKTGWGTYVVEYNIGKKRKVSFGGRDKFITTFFDDVLLNHSCFDCSYRQKYSGADFRIGDFWGMRFREDRKGVSAVTIFTEAGQNFFENLNMEILGEYSTEECLSAQSTKPYPRQEYHDLADAELSKDDASITKIVKNYRKEFSKGKRRKILLKKMMSYLPGQGREIQSKIIKLIKGINRNG